MHSGTSLALILFVLIFNLFFSVFNVGAFICMIATATGVGYFILMNAFHGVFGGSADHPFEWVQTSITLQLMILGDTTVAHRIKLHESKLMHSLKRSCQLSISFLSSFSVLYSSSRWEQAQRYFSLDVFLTSSNR